MNKVINIQVDDSYAKGDGCVVGAKGSGNDVTLRMTFNSSWDGLAITGCWEDALGQEQVQIFTESSGHYDIVVPPFAKSEAGFCSLSVKGSQVDTHTLVPSVNSTTWESSTLGGSDGTFTFVRGDLAWYYNGASVTLATYGVTYSGDPLKGDKIVVKRESGDSVSVSVSATEYHPVYKGVKSTKIRFRVMDSGYDIDNAEILQPSDAELLIAQVNTYKASCDYSIAELTEDIGELEAEFGETKSYLDDKYSGFKTSVDQRVDKFEVDATSTLQQISIAGSTQVSNINTQGSSIIAQAQAKADLAEGYSNQASGYKDEALGYRNSAKSYSDNADAQSTLATQKAQASAEALLRIQSIAQGIQKAISFDTKDNFLSWYNNGTSVTINGQSYNKNDLRVGDDIYIKEKMVADLWFTGVNETDTTVWWYGLPFSYLETDTTKIAEYTARCESAKASASSSATAANTSAGNASSSATAASQSALSASASAGAASTSEVNAAESASSAASSATAAEGEVTKAKAEVVKAETQVSLATAQANIATEKAQEIASSAATISQHSTEIAELKTRVETLEDIQELDINKIQQVVRGGVASKYIQVGDVISTYKETSITANIGLSQGITAVSIDSNAFMSAYGHSFNGEVMFIYDDSKWYLHEEEINISTYGLTITGSARNGDEIIVHETSSKLKFDVMDFDTETPSDTTKTHSLPLMLQDVFSYGSLPFCSGQLMYWARDGLSAGTYYFRCYRADYNCTNNDYYMQFTITQDIEAGGGLKHNRLGVYQSNSANYSKDYMLGGSITTYSAMVNANGIYTRPSIETVSVTEGQSGTYLGCFSAEFYSGYTTADALHNATRRNGHGNNRWDTSYHRQWLNSSVSANVGWYTPKSNFDMPPSEALQKWAGFLNGIDADFVNAIGTTKQKCATGSWDRGMGESDYYITEDKIFYASMTNMNRGNNNGVAEGSAWKYWRDHNTNADRIKYQGTTARYWWLRSCDPSYCDSTRFIYTSGALRNYSANNSDGVVPACVII